MGESLSGAHNKIGELRACLSALGRVVGAADGVQRACVGGPEQPALAMALKHRTTVRDLLAWQNENAAQEREGEVEAFISNLQVASDGSISLSEVFRAALGAIAQSQSPTISREPIAKNDCQIEGKIGEQSLQPEIEAFFSAAIIRGSGASFRPTQGHGDRQGPTREAGRCLRGARRTR